MEVGYDEVLESFLKSYKGPVERHKKSDDLIWLVLGDKEHIDWQAVEAFKAQFESAGWKIDVNGRKIYLYPEFVNKWAAVDYVRKQYGKGEKVIAAGDSLFDYEMVHQADYGVVPKQAWIEEECKPGIQITSHMGLEAAEDLLAFALEKVKHLQDLTR